MTVPVVRFTVAGDDTLPPADPGHRYTVVFDGDCRICMRLSRALRAWDRNGDFEIVASQTAGVMARFPWIPARAYGEALQLIAADGTTWQGAAAIEEILRILPRGRAIAWIFHIPLIRGLADRAYKWFARNRYRLGCGEHCQARPLDVAWADAERAER